MDKAGQGSLISKLTEKAEVLTGKVSDFTAYAKDSIQAKLPSLSPRNKGPNRVGYDGFSFVEPIPSLEHVIHLGAMPDQTKESSG